MKYWLVIKKNTVSTQIRRQMIDGKPGEMTIRTLIKSIDEVSS